SQQSTINTLKPVYNLIELGLDDYNENELVLDTINDLKLFFENSNNLGFKRFFERHFELKALEAQEHELFIKSQLLSFEITNEKSDNKMSEKHTYKFNYNNSLPLCKPAYLKLCGMNSYLLFTLQTHLQLNGLTECIHRNTGHASKTELSFF
ncbi:23275_t:CDS:2, partial [Racocetra persica]